MFQQDVRRLDVRIQRQTKAKTKFGVVLKQGIRPGGTATVRVRGVGSRRQIAAVDRRTASSIGNHQAIAEELRQQLHIRRFAAAGAGARIFEKRFERLGTFVIETYHAAAIQFRQLQENVV